MRNKTDSSLEIKKPNIFRRIRQHLVLPQIEKVRDTANRPLVGNFLKNHESLIDYARKNAMLADMDKDENNYHGLLRHVYSLQESFGSAIRGNVKPTANRYGFSKERPLTVFRWNLNKMSESTSEDLLYGYIFLNSVNCESG